MSPKCSLQLGDPSPLYSSSLDLLSSFKRVTSPCTSNTSFPQGCCACGRKLHLVFLACSRSDCPSVGVFSWCIWSTRTPCGLLAFFITSALWRLWCKRSSIQIQRKGDCLLLNSMPCWNFLATLRDIGWSLYCLLNSWLLGWIILCMGGCLLLCKMLTASLASLH